MSVKPVAVVTGARGQLGSALVQGLAADYRVVAFSRAELDVTDHAAVMRQVVDASPSVILNATAYNNVDGAEDDPITAFSINAVAVRSLARAAEVTDAVFVHYSSDFVFDGETHRPYTEEDQPCPRSVYAQSKLVGEWMAASVPFHYVLRVESLFGGPHARSSIDRFVESLRAGREVHAFRDREVSPSFVEDVVVATRALLDIPGPFGVYHCVNTGHTTWFDVAREVATRIGVANAQIAAVSIRDVELRAARPRYAALDNGKLRSLDIEMPTWQDALARYLSES